MDIFSLLSYINKVSLLAFFVTIVVVGYQIYVLKKEKTNEKAPAIPDFKEGIKSNEVVNYTSLPGSLTKRDNKPANNYSRLIFLTIFSLTAVVVIFVLILAKKNNPPLNTETSPPIVTNNNITPTIAVPSKTATLEANLVLSPSPTVNPSPIITERMNPSPTEILTPTPTGIILPSPTEIILAKVPSVTPPSDANVSEESNNSQLKTLPETGSIQKGLLIIGAALSTIFFSFWF